ncbi:MAG: hypothetical protein IPP14_06805 [Planctomycetes bacterium]|nr:hypothetical protein [Planctomycetota bacterium]
MAESPAQLPATASRWSVLEKAWLQALIVAVVYFTGMLYYQWVPAPDFTGEKGGGLRANAVGLPDPDTYYHIKMGWLYSTGEVQQAGVDFHWTRESTWHGAFSDKDYLFHVYLAPFSRLADGPGDFEGLILGARLGIALLSTLFALALWGCLRAFRVRHAWLYTLLLTAAGGSYIVFRVNMCRSYMISLALACIGWVLLVRRCKLPLFLLCVVYTLSYTASHLMLAMQIIRMVVEFVIGGDAGRSRKQDLKSNLALCASIVAGIALGCLLHPHPRELVSLWWVQNVVVLALSHRDSIAPVVDSFGQFFGIGSDYVNGPAIALGRELEPPLGSFVATSAPVLWAGPMLLPLFSSFLGHRPSRAALLTGIMAVVWFVAFMTNQRFIEYAAPFSVLACGLWIHELLACPAYAAWRQRRPVVARAVPLCGAIVALIATGAIWVGAAINYRSTDRGFVAEAGQWLHEHPESHGKVVWHDRWDDFTKLIFYASECDYLIGLDPTFMLAKDRARYEQWMDLCRGKQRELVDPIQNDFGASYILFRRSSSEYAYYRLTEEARAGRLRLCVRAANDDWSLYEIVKQPKP